MMGYQPDAQPKLFYHSFNLEERIPANSVLRNIRGHRTDKRDAHNGFRLHQ